MYKSLCLWAIFSLFISACGGGGSGDVSDSGSNKDNKPQETDAPLNSKFYGIWMLSSDQAYAVISKDSITTFSYDGINGCYESGLFTVDRSTATSLTSTDIQTGEQSISTFELNQDTLIVKEEGDQLSFFKTDFFNPTPGCASYHGVESVDIKLELAYLPPSVMVNRDVQDTGRTEYNYQIVFDLNGNDIVDPSDILIAITYYKSRDNYPDNHEIAIAELGGEIWTYESVSLSEIIRETTNEGYDNEVDVTQDQNILSFSFNINQYPLLAHINENTPVYVLAFMSYPEPEPTIIEGWDDGPWNWSSARHIDLLLGGDFTQPSSHLDMKIEDATLDLIEGEALWVDIKSAQFIFNK